MLTLILRAVGLNATADRFGGTTRGDSLANRQASARQQLGRQSGNLPSNRGGGADLSNRGGAGVSNRAGGGGFGDRSGGSGQNRIGSRDLTRNGGGNRDAFGGGSRGSSGYNGSSARVAKGEGTKFLSFQEFR
jgi:hypothetical protein